VRSLDENPKELSLGRAFVRAIAYNASYFIFGLGFLLPLFRKDKATLHDLISRTQVLQEDREDI